MAPNPQDVAARYLDRTAGDVAETMALLHKDPKLVKVLRQYPAWREPDTPRGELVRDDGAEVGMTGVQGVWVAEHPRSGTLRGRGGGVRRFKRPSAAILAIEAEYPSR